MTSNWDKIASANNESILMFNSSRNDQAARQLTELLISLKAILMSSPSPAESEDDGDASDTSMTNSLHAAISLPSLPPRCNYVYNNAFNLSLKNLQDGCPCSTPNDESTPHVFTACVIFNLAIMHHNLGLRRNVSDFLRKAENLYKMSLRILCSCRMDDATARLVRTVCYNNLAQIYVDRGDSEEAESCLKSLATLVESDYCVYDFTDEEYNGILANLLLLIPASTAAAA